MRQLDTGQHVDIVKISMFLDETEDILNRMVQSTFIRMIGHADALVTDNLGPADELCGDKLPVTENRMRMQVDHSFPTSCILYLLPKAFQAHPATCQNPRS